ncbi:hypothetical protein OH77DRAFT_1431269 [Trametes cingulata]|nr:hypothetical protein OH77DRAFT_1431269 [Trametes cingulata]
MPALSSLVALQVLELKAASELGTFTRKISISSVKAVVPFVDASLNMLLLAMLAAPSTKLGTDAAPKLAAIKEVAIVLSAFGRQLLPHDCDDFPYLLRGALPDSRGVINLEGDDSQVRERGLAHRITALLKDLAEAYPPENYFTLWLAILAAVERERDPEGFAARFSGPTVVLS